MRCQFCGWDNPQGKNSCEKCGKPLEADNSVEPSNIPSGSIDRDHSTSRQATSNKELKATVREKKSRQMDSTDAQKRDEACPICGYTLENGMCSSCGYSNENNGPEKVVDNNVPNEEVEEEFSGKDTIRPHRKGGHFYLTPISEKTGQPESDPILYKGNTVVLNRANTDSSNKAITSRQQAEVCCEDGKWSIVDKSEFKTTFVQAVRKIELNDGDLILLGTQLYQFNND